MCITVGKNIKKGLKEKVMLLENIKKKFIGMTVNNEQDIIKIQEDRDVIKLMNNKIPFLSENYGKFHISLASLSTNYNYLNLDPILNFKDYICHCFNLDIFLNTDFEVVNIIFTQSIKTKKKPNIMIEMLSKNVNLYHTYDF